MSLGLSPVAGAKKHDDKITYGEAHADLVDEEGALKQL
jgi:hypothetical protein